MLVRLGEPCVGGLRLVFDAGDEPSADELARLAAFGARRPRGPRGRRTSDLTQELERSRALLRSSGRRSPSCRSRTLETAVDRVGELLGTDRAAVYLRQAGGLEAAAERGLAGPHVRVAEGFST